MPEISAGRLGPETQPPARPQMLALISPLRFHLRWVCVSATIAAILILACYLCFATRFTVTTQIAFDTSGPIMPASRLEADLLAPERIGRTVDRLGIDRWAGSGVSAAARARTIGRIRKGLHVEQTDLTNMFVLRYTSGSRRQAAPILNDLAEGLVGAGATPAGVRAQIVARAADPVAPDGALLLPFGLALAGAALAGLATLLVRERRQDGPRFPLATERMVGLPVVGMIPQVGGMAAGRRDALTELPVTAQQSEYARAFRRLLASGQASGRIVAVCSALEAEGKSTSAISLARTAALAGRRVAIVDCDGRIRAASEALDVLGKPGLVQVMGGTVPVERALIADTRSNMMILGFSEDAALQEFWSREAMAALTDVIGTLAGRFDLVVIDTPPLLALAEARDIAALADEALVITRWRATPIRALRMAAGILAEKGIKAGIVLSFVRLAEPDRGPIVPGSQRQRRPGHRLVVS